VKARSAPPARRSISLWRALRIAVLAYLLVMVAVTAWLTKARSTDWDDTLYMAIYPVNGDHSETSRDYVAALDVSEFNAIPEFFEREGARYGIDLTHLVAIDLGAEIPEAPPAPPTDGNPSRSPGGACGCAGSRGARRRISRCRRPISACSSSTTIHRRTRDSRTRSVLPRASSAS
jgi:hypothetical protein